MAYIKQDWTSGDVITAEKLNHIEDGIANSEPSIPLLFLNPGMGGGFYSDYKLEHPVMLMDAGYNYNSFEEALSASEEFSNYFTSQNPRIIRATSYTSPSEDEVELMFNYKIKSTESSVQQSLESVQYNVTYGREEDPDTISLVNYNLGES